MAGKDETIKEYEEQIDALKKAVAVLLSRVQRLENRGRSNEAGIRNNARDIRNLAIKISR